MCPLGRKGLSEASGFQPKGLRSGLGVGEAGRAVFLQAGLAWVSAVQMGMQPQTPPSAQLLCVLSSARSDYLEVVHLLPVLRLSIFAFSPWAPELRRCHPLLTYSASGTLPGSVLSECWEAADPLGHLGTPTTTQGEALPLPGAGARRRGTSSACRCHVRLELSHGPASRTGGLTSQRDGTSRVAGGSSEAAKQGTKLPKRC